jgi:hypothetical protein
MSGELCEFEPLCIAGFHICRIQSQRLLELKQSILAWGFSMIDIAVDNMGPFIYTQSELNQFGSPDFRMMHLRKAIGPIPEDLDLQSVCYGTFRGYGCKIGVMLYDNDEHATGFRMFHVVQEHRFYQRSPAPKGFRLKGGVYGGGTRIVVRDYVGEGEISLLEDQWGLDYVYPRGTGFSMFGLIILPQFKTIYCGYEVSEVDTYFNYHDKYDANGRRKFFPISIG